MFSALIPVYNHARFLRQAVESAIRDPLVGEVLVVDDGSQDRSQAVIGELGRLYAPRLRDIGDGRGTNKGAHVRLNELVEAARHEWVGVLNSDDMFVPGRFAVARAALRSCSTQFVTGQLLIADACGQVFGRKRGWLDPEYPFPADLRQEVGRANRWRDPLWQETFRARLLNQNFIATTSNMVFTKTLHGRIGGFRDYRYCHDWDFALRSSFDGDIAWCPQYLSVYRIHGTNTIADAKDRIRVEVQRMFRMIEADSRGIPLAGRCNTGRSENEYLRAA